MENNKMPNEAREAFGLKPNPEPQQPKPEPKVEPKEPEEDEDGPDLYADDNDTGFIVYVINGHYIETYNGLVTSMSNTPPQGEMKLVKTNYDEFDKLLSSGQVKFKPKH